MIFSTTILRQDKRWCLGLNAETKERLEMINRGEVPEGYKKTKVGIIPEDWGVKRLIDVSDSSDRYSITGGPFGSDLKTEHYTDGGVRILQLQNIGDGVFIDDYNIYTSNKKADELYSCNIYPGEILIAKMAEPLARACIVLDKEKRYLMSSDGIRLKVDSNKYNTKYILEYINSNRFRNEAIKRSTGTTRLRIGLGELKKIKIVIPNKSEQQKIAQILSTWDKAIELKEILIEEKKELKKGLMQRLLTGKVRLPGFDGEWEEVRLGKVSRVIMGQSPSSRNYNKDNIGLPLIQGNTDIKNRYTAPRLFTSEITKTCDIDNIIMSVRAPVGVIAKSVHKACIGRGVCAIKPIDNNDFLYYYLVNSERVWIKYSQGSTFESVNSSDIKKFMILRPNSQEEQKAIAQILSTADKEIELLKEEVELLKLQKKGLMQLLLTGIIRVKS